MKFRLGLFNLRTKQHEIEHSVLSFTGVSRLLGTALGCDPELTARILEEVIKGKKDTFEVSDDEIEDKFRVIIQVLE